MFLKGWSILFGNGETALRLHSALLGILTIPLLYPLGRRLYGPRVALLACALLAVAPYHIQYSQEVRHYVLLPLLAILSFDGLDRLARRPTVWAAVEYVVAGTLLFYTLAYGIFILAAHAGCVAATWLVERRITRRAVWGWLGLAGIIGLLCAPYLGVFADQVRRAEQGLWVPRPSLVDLLHTFQSFAGSGALLPLFLIAAATAFVALERTGGGWDRRQPLRSAETIVWRARLNDLGPGLALAIWLLAPVVLPFVMSRFSQPIYLVRTTIAAMPALMLLAARGLARLEPRGAGRVAFALVGLATIAALANYYTTAYKEPWRTVAREVEAQAAADDLIVFDAGFAMGAIYDYYSTRPELARLPLRNSGPAYSIEDLAPLAEAAAGRTRVWVIRSHGVDGENLVAPLLREAGLPRARVRDYPPGIRVEVYDRLP